MDEECINMIPNIHDLINPHLPCDHSKVISVKCSRLKFVDKYGSIMLKVDINLVNTTNGEDWKLNAMAKTFPKSTISHGISDLQNLFRKEVGIYTIALRAIDAFFREKGVGSGVEFSGYCLGGRLNLNGSKEVDQNAVLILNTQFNLGYKIAHRRTGYDVNVSRGALNILAKLHAGALALKLLKPNRFRDEIQPYLIKFSSYVDITRAARSQMISILKNEGFNPDEIQRAIGTFDRKDTGKVREPWGTFSHSNLWVGNIVVKFDKKSNRHVDIKFKGFQESQYGSPLHDLLFFLFTSVEFVGLRQHLDELIDVYYNSLIDYLNKLGVDANPFSRPAFDRELKEVAAGGEFYKTVCMLYPILCTNRDIEDVGDDDYVPDLKDDLHIKRLSYIVREYDKRGWLEV